MIDNLGGGDHASEVRHDSDEQNSSELVKVYVERECCFEDVIGMDD